MDSVRTVWSRTVTKICIDIILRWFRKSHHFDKTHYDIVTYVLQYVNSFGCLDMLCFVLEITFDTRNQL